MDSSEEHLKLLLNKEWLVKIDTAKSTPYLLKFYHSTVDLSCVVLLTDTKRVWMEALSSQQFARRWRQCNPNAAELCEDVKQENSWRSSNLELLSKIHSLGGITDLSFDVVDSNISDLAVELEDTNVKWKWETCFLGYRQSAEVISKHLLFPLISLSNLAFSSPDLVSELSDPDMEKAVDKTGRTARRAVDTHIRNVFMKPRMATAIRRMTETFNFAVDPSPIKSVAEKPDLQPEATEPADRPWSKASVEGSNTFSSATTSTIPVDHPPHQPKNTSKPAVSPDSATESEGEDPMHPVKIKDRIHHPSATETMKNTNTRIRSPSPLVNATPALPQNSDSDSSPLRAASAKKPRLACSSDDEGEGEKKLRPSQAPANRGARQPIKRGGKRF